MITQNGQSHGEKYKRKEGKHETWMAHGNVEKLLVFLCSSLNFNCPFHYLQHLHFRIRNFSTNFQKQKERYFVMKMRSQFTRVEKIQDSKNFKQKEINDGAFFSPARLFVLLGLSHSLIFAMLELDLFDLWISLQLNNSHFWPLCISFYFTFEYYYHAWIWIWMRRNIISLFICMFSRWRVFLCTLAKQWACEKKIRVT